MSEDLAVFGEGSLTFHEFAMKESLPLATIHTAVLEFLRGRTDAVLFGRTPSMCMCLKNARQRTWTSSR